MWPFDHAKRYEAVATDEEESKLAPLRVARAAARRRMVYLMSGILLALTAIATGAFFYKSHSKIVPSRQDDLIDTSDEAQQAASPSVNSTCRLRREWRTLSREDQQHYISSIRCLLGIPSTIEVNSSRYGDWPYVHSHVGYYTHHSAPFLPWHRYFLHIYETTLRSECGFKGELVYWDWTLDAADLAHSSVFDPETGFGGDGEVGGEITVGNSGRCVVDGPFKDIRAKYYDTKPLPHCLSRGFHDDSGALGRMDGSGITPESIEEVMRAGDYETFVGQLESKVHDAIPFGVGGDFETFTAPYGESCPADLVANESLRR